MGARSEDSVRCLGGRNAFTERHFDRVAMQYTSLRQTDDEAVFQIRDRLPSGPVTGLDVGAGTGRYTERLVELLGDRATIHAVDLSPAMLLVLLRDGMPDRLPVACCQAERLPIADGSVDFVTTFNAVHHFDLDGFVQEAERVLAPGGHLFIYTRTPDQNAESIWGRAFPDFTARENRLYNETTLRSVAATPGDGGREIVQLPSPCDTHQAGRASQRSRLLDIRPVRRRRTRRRARQLSPRHRRPRRGVLAGPQHARPRATRSLPLTGVARFWPGLATQYCRRLRWPWRERPAGKRGEPGMTSAHTTTTQTSWGRYGGRGALSRQSSRRRMCEVSPSCPLPRTRQPEESAIEIFMFCDLGRYELSAKGSMCGKDADPLGDAILLVPEASAATIDLRGADEIDDIAAAGLAFAVLRRQQNGVEFAILVGSEAASRTLAEAGLAPITHRSVAHSR